MISQENLIEKETIIFKDLSDILGPNVHEQSFVFKGFIFGICTKGYIKLKINYNTHHICQNGIFIIIPQHIIHIKECSSDFEMKVMHILPDFLCTLPITPDFNLLKQTASTLYCTPKVRHKTFGVFFMKYSYEQRLIIVSRVKQGELIAHLSKEYHINKTQILAWVRMWDKYGPSGLEQQPHCRPTVKLKEEVVRLILEKGVPLSHVRIEYRIGKTALQRWVSTVRKYGYEALAPSKRQGRALKEPMGRPKKKEPQTELERLQAENLRLRAENALLKKAKALVEAKKAQALLNGREPSTN